MARLTLAQMAQAARAGGLPGDPNMWAAVGMAESSGDPEIINSIGCVGIWQINQPVHIKSHPTWTVKWLQNPVNNARAAAVIYHQQGMDAWEGYTGPSGHGSDGPWKQYYKGGSATGGVTQANWWDDWIGGSKDFQKGFNDPFGLGGTLGGLGVPMPDYNQEFGGGGLGGLGSVATGIGTMAEAVQKSAVWLGNARNWIRIGYVVGGGALVMLGLSVVAKPLLNATPAGRMAKAAGGAVKKAGGAVKTKNKGDSGGE